jgi:hypothetical protein
MSDREKQPTEIELAAKKFEFLAAGAPLSNVLFGYPDQKRLWWLAARALRAEEEREKGCEYCKNRFGIATHHVTESGMQAGTNKAAAFCPMCGRKLDEGGQDARKGVADG